jgi:orotidine-5'-phosphate decarboxylase
MPEIMVALDFPDRESIFRFLEAAEEDLRWVKIGLQLFCRYGPGLVEEIAARGPRIFLDLKLHDIPNTVAGAVESLAHLPVELLTLHAGGGEEMTRRAVEARNRTNPRLKLLAVTVLTSLDDPAIRAIGFALPAPSLVRQLAGLSLGAGVDGLVCSPLEVAALRERHGTGPLLVVPGIRPAGSDRDEQKRVLTPREAAEAGADFLVIGRPVTRSGNPKEALASIRDSLLAR